MYGDKFHIFITECRALLLVLGREKKLESYLGKYIVVTFNVVLCPVMIVRKLLVVTEINCTTLTNIGFNYFDLLFITVCSNVYNQL